MNLKDLFIATLDSFKADVAMRANAEQDRFIYRTLGMCAALDAAAEVNKIKWDDTVYKDARKTLASHRPDGSSAYWWPVKIYDSTYEEAVLPRLAVLNKIIESL